MPLSSKPTARTLQVAGEQRVASSNIHNVSASAILLLIGWCDNPRASITSAIQRDYANSA
jgi:hypothetical protein